MTINLTIFQFIYSLNRFLPTNWHISLFLGGYLIFVLLGFALGYLLLNNHSAHNKIKWLAILLLAIILSNVIIKPLINHFYPVARPFVSLRSVGAYNYLLKASERFKSFPSGHTTMAFAIAMVLFLRNKKIGANAFIAAFFVGLGRILLGLHWPLDILGGIAIGLLSGFLAGKLIAKIK